MHRKTWITTALVAAGLLAFVLFRLFSARRQPAAAGGAAYARTSAQPASLFGTGGAAVRPAIRAPAWFDEKRFIEQGRQALPVGGIDHRRDVS